MCGHVVSVLANETLVRTRQNRHFFNILPSIKNNLHTHCCQKCIPVSYSVYGCNIPKIKVVVLSVRQLRHGFTKKAKVSPNLAVAQIGITRRVPVQRAVERDEIPYP